MIMRRWLQSAGIRVAVAGTAALAAVGGVGFAAYAYTTTAHLGATTPGAGAEVSARRPAIAIQVSHASRLGRYTLIVDGRDLTTRTSLAGGAIRLGGVRLTDGRHTVSVRATSD